MKNRSKKLESKLNKIVKALEVDKLESKLGELETKSMENDFWDNPRSAKDIMQRISDIQDILKNLEKLRTDIDNLDELTKMAEAEEDSKEMEKELEQEYRKIKDNLDRFELRQFLSDKYDRNSAILSIHAGQGGTEANDWAEMLLRMYFRYAENQGWKTSILNQIKGDEAGIQTVSVEIEGPLAFGYLKKEKGTHRLIRQSPFNAQNLRQTSFAGVEVLPVIDFESEKEFEIPEDEIEFSAARSGGPGGQHANKASTAVTLTHKPTGVTVQSSSRRSQHQNRETAMKLLKSKLWEIEQEKISEEKKEIKGEHKIAAWGNQIRNYILHPYKLVKDLRTEVESNDPEAVLDGDLDKFIQAEIRL